MHEKVLKHIIKIGSYWYVVFENSFNNHFDGFSEMVFNEFIVPEFFKTKLLDNMVGIE